MSAFWLKTSLDIIAIENVTVIREKKAHRKKEGLKFRDINVEKKIMNAFARTKQTTVKHIISEHKVEC